MERHPQHIAIWKKKEIIEHILHYKAILKNRSILYVYAHVHRDLYVWKKYLERYPANY